jgi:hypothetical protein
MIMVTDIMLNILSENEKDDIMQHTMTNHIKDQTSYATTVAEEGASHPCYKGSRLHATL